MPVFSVNNSKYLSSNDDKTKNVVIEYAKDLVLSDLLERITEFRDAILKGMEEEEKAKKAAEVKAEETKKEEEIPVIQPSEIHEVSKKKKN
jgi:hypothetical protein